MKLKNIGSKIINVGSTVMMPGDEGEFPKSMVDTPAILVLCKLGYLEMSESEPAPVKEEEPEAEQEEKTEEVGEEPEATEEPEEKPVKKARRTRAKKTAE